MCQPLVLKRGKEGLYWNLEITGKSPCLACGIWVTDRTHDGGRYFYGRIGVCGVFNSRHMSHL